MGQEITILVSVISGALGVSILRSGIRLVRKFHAERKPLAEYDCGDENTDPGCCERAGGRDSLMRVQVIIRHGLTVTTGLNRDASIQSTVPTRMTLESLALTKLLFGFVV